MQRVIIKTRHEYVCWQIRGKSPRLTKWFREIGDETEVVAGPYAVDRLIEDSHACRNIQRESSVRTKTYKNVSIRRKGQSRNGRMPFTIPSSTRGLRGVKVWPESP